MVATNLSMQAMSTVLYKLKNAAQGYDNGLVFCYPRLCSKIPWENACEGLFLY